MAKPVTGRIQVGKTNMAILNGDEDVTLWDDEELIRGQRRAKNVALRWSAAHDRCSSCSSNVAANVGGTLTERRPAVVFGSPNARRPFTSESCSTTLTVRRSRSTRFGAPPALRAARSVWRPERPGLGSPPAHLGR